MSDKSAIAGRIKVLRGKLSQRAFAEKVGFKQTYISQVETGRSSPSVDLLIAIADEFETTIDFVLRGGKLERIHNPEKLAKGIFLESLNNIQKAITQAEHQLKAEAS